MVSAGAERLPEQATSPVSCGTVHTVFGAHLWHEANEARGGAVWGCV